MYFTESTDSELKEIFVTDIKKEVIAFANTHGGKIYIGVSDVGKIICLEALIKYYYWQLMSFVTPSN